MELRFRVFRFDPDRDAEPHYDDYTVEAEPNIRLLDCFNKIRWEQDPGLSYRWSSLHSESSPSTYGGAGSRKPSPSFVAWAATTGKPAVTTRSRCSAASVARSS